MVYVLGYQLLGNHDEALELSQDVFLRVFRNIGRFQGRSTLRTWIYRIVINSARNRQRWWGRWRACVVSLESHIRSHGDPPAPATLASPEQALSQKELADRVWRALATLPLEQRSAIILRELHGIALRRDRLLPRGHDQRCQVASVARARCTSEGVATTMSINLLLGRSRSADSSS